MKKTYEKPTIEITEFEVEDIIASGANGLMNGGDGTSNAVGWNAF
jgi:hypothetical protein